MKLAISNIAWDIAADGKIAQLLNQYDVAAIDIAPAKYFSRPADATSVDIARIKDWWAFRGIEIYGMQALLTGTTGFNVFGTLTVQTAMLQHLSHICRIAAGLSVRRLVFGSPKNRDRGKLSDAETTIQAVSFFQRLGRIADQYDVVICLEPNPACYGANFMTSSVETAEMVKHIAHPAIRMQFDTGALTLNQECPTAVLQQYRRLIGHIHLSEPHLQPLGDGTCNHVAMAGALRHYLPGQWASIEMRVSDSAEEVSIERALRLAIRHYRTTTPGPPVMPRAAVSLS